jgi:hypothetical protein
VGTTKSYGFVVVQPDTEKILRVIKPALSGWNFLRNPDSKAIPGISVTGVDHRQHLLNRVAPEFMPNKISSSGNFRTLTEAGWVTERVARPIRALKACFHQAM